MDGCSLLDVVQLSGGHHEALGMLERDRITHAATAAEIEGVGSVAGVGALQEAA